MVLVLSENELLILIWLWQHCLKKTIEGLNSIKAWCTRVYLGGVALLADVLLSTVLKLEGACLHGSVSIESSGDSLGTQVLNVISRF